MPRFARSAPSVRPRPQRGEPPPGLAEGAIILLARAPVPGTVKTRMCPPLTPEEAAALQGSLVMDAVEGVQSLRRDFDLYVACAPGMDHPFFQTLAARHRMRRFDQTGEDLGRRMDHALTDVLSRGHRYAALAGTDTPALARRHYARAKDVLRSRDVVFGPAEDGGYYLVGLKRPAPALFDAISWSTEHVLAQSLARAATLGLAVGLLDRERDLDTVDDVRAVLREGSGAGPRTLPARTAGVLRMILQRHGEKRARRRRPVPNEER